ncbi:ABC transporter permease [Deinococcus ficus]|uniref:ABC transporter permease n=1 Tax=Deinococcus ficus TaxID=317577 RepID=A0A221SZE3_9DEIO|nr:ABC transporter permease [Deinococcus ficus]ASN82015.1 ABC transporter permease [Deinococcus ficus]
MTHDPDPRPSPTAAVIARIASGAGLLGMLLFPLAALGRGFDADAVLLHLSGSLLTLGAAAPERLPETGTVLALGWVALALLAATLFGAVQRTRWFWITGLLAALAAFADVLLLNSALGAEVARVANDAALRPGAKRQLRNFYGGGGMNLGLLLPILGGLISAGAGLSARRAWHDRFNRVRGLLVPATAITLAILVGAIVVLVVQPAVNLSGKPLGLWGGWLAKSDLVYFVYSTLFAPVTRFNSLLDSLKLATPLIFTGLSVAFAFRTGLFNIGAPGQLTIGAIFAMLVGVYGPAGLGWLLLPLSIVAAGLGGALWGAIPGLLKARFGSSEVINTIMLNYIASAIFVTMLGSTKIFGVQLIGAALLALAAIPLVNLLLRRLPNLNPVAKAPLFAVAYLLAARALYSLLTAALPTQVFTNTIRVDGYEAKSQELQETSRLPTMIDLLNVGTADTVKISLGLLFALAAYLLVRTFLKAGNRNLIALAAALVAGAVTWRIGVPVVTPGNTFNASFLIALAGVILFGTLMWRTSTGYALRAVGLSPKAAEYGGISVAKNTVLAMTVAGMFAGLAGTHYVNGGAMDEYALRGNTPVNVGFDGIAVALMGQNTPAGVVASALLFGTIDTGGVDVDQKLDGVSKDIVTVLKALVVLFIAAGGFLSRRIIDPPPAALTGGNTAPPAAVEVTSAVPAPSQTPTPQVAPGEYRTPEAQTPDQKKEDQA